jgi:ankyrin repeat protein
MATEKDDMMTCM